METLTLEKACNIYQPKTISQKEMKQDGKYLVFGANGIIGKYDKYNHEESEVAITCRGATCGKVNYTSPKSWITGNAMVVSPDQNKLKKRYLFYYLNYIDLSKTITGTAQPQITRTNLKNIKINIPDLTVQKKIILKLDKINEAIENRKQTIKDFEKIIDSKFYEMFGDPELNTNNYPLEELGNLCDLITYGLTVRPKYYTKGIPLISAREIKTGKIDFSNSPKISNEDFIMQSDKSKPKKGNILFSKTGTIGYCALVEDETTFIVTQNATRIQLSKNSGILEQWLLYYLRRPYIQLLAQKMAKGNTVKDLQIRDIKKFKLYIPPIEEQDKFIKYVNNFNKIKELIQQDLKDLEALIEVTKHEHFG